MKHGNFTGTLYTTELVSAVEIINVSTLQVPDLDPGRDINYPEVCVTLLSKLTQIDPFRDEAQTAVFKDPVRTAP